MTTPSKRTFYRHVFSIEVLSEEELGSMSLVDIEEAITTGHCSGQFLETAVTKVRPKTMAKLLLKQGSDPEFFQLDEQGNDLEDA